MSDLSWRAAALGFAAEEWCTSQDILLKHLKKVHASPPTRDEFRGWAKKSDVLTGLLKPESVRAFSERPGVRVSGDQAVVVSDVSPDLGDIETLISERGLSPRDWDVKQAILNEWDSNLGNGEVGKLRQLKITLARKTPVHFVFPAVEVKPRVFKPKKKAGKRSVNLLVGDQHAPFHDRQMHEAFCRFAQWLDPDRLVNLGDVGDYGTISRFRDNVAWDRPVQECVDSSHSILADYRSATDAEIVMLKGNHDWRLETELLARAERMYGIKPAEIPGSEQVPAYSLRHLLHLDALGISLVEPERAGDEYQHAELWLSPGLVAIHGKHVKNGAEHHAESIGASTITGHTHKLKHTHITRWENDRRRTLDCVEAGTAREISVSVGYANRPKSQNGVVVATVFDGGHQVELVPFQDGAFLFRGERYA